MRCEHRECDVIIDADDVRTEFSEILADDCDWNTNTSDVVTFPADVSSVDGDVTNFGVSGDDGDDDWRIVSSLDVRS